jgi:hypothetical protein
MRQVLLSILKMQETQISLLGQVAADVSALKNVVRILDARAESLLEREVALERYKFEVFLEVHRQEIQTLRLLISQPENQTPN